MRLNLINKKRKLIHLQFLYLSLMFIYSEQVLSATEVIFSPQKFICEWGGKS